MKTIWNKRMSQTTNHSNMQITLLALIITLLSFFAPNSYGQENCNTSLKVQANRTIRTLIGTQYSYPMILKNGDDIPHEYTIKAQNFNENCENPDSYPNDENIDLDISILSNESNELKLPVSVAPGESIQFLIKLSIRKDTPFGFWNCTQVSAKAEGCPESLIQLHTFYPNPENLE